MRVLFVDSGAQGFHTRYAFDIFFTLKKLRHKARQISPAQLSPRLIQKFQPDVLLVVHGSRTPLSQVHYARSLGVKTVLWIVEDPYEIDLHRGAMVEAYDLVYTNERQAVKHYKPVKAMYLPWCCNPEVHRRMEVSAEYRSDLCFVGMGFPNRLRILNAIAPLLKELNIKLIGRWQRWGELHPDLQKFVLPVENDFYEVQKYFNGAKINLNIHRDPVDPPSGNSRKVKATSPNDRTFALAGCGAFQIVDATRPDLFDCFTENKEIVVFSSPRDLARKIEYYLANPKLRQKIGKAAQKRAYREHTFEQRLKQIFSDLGKIPKKKWSAPLSQPTVYYLQNEHVRNGQIWYFHR